VALICGGIDIGHRERAAAQQHGDLVGIDFVVFGFATVNGFHIKGMAEDKGDFLLGAEIGEPVPGEDALDGDGHVLSVRRDGFEEQLRTARHIAVQENLAVSIQDTDVHRSGMQIDPAVVSVLLSVEFHLEVSSFKSVFGETRAYQR
jgi:hypothetical protein